MREKQESCSVGITGTFPPPLSSRYATRSINPVHMSFNVGEFTKYKTHKRPPSKLLQSKSDKMLYLNNCNLSFDQSAD